MKKIPKLEDTKSYLLPLYPVNKIWKKQHTVKIILQKDTTKSFNSIKAPSQGVFILNSY